MPRGLPDYYNPDTLVSQRLANVEEIVTAIQGIANLDNRGRTLWFTNFKDGVNGWYAGETGDGTIPDVTTDEAEIEPQSFKMDAGTDSGAGKTLVQKGFIIHSLKSAGLEFSYAHRANSAEITVDLAYDNGVNALYGQIIIDPQGQTINIMDGSTPRLVFALPYPIAPTDWATIKLVCNFDTSTYVRLLVGLNQIDISDYTLHSSASILKGDFYARFATDAIDDGVNIAYVGHVGITIDEP